jgi:hypothetical protein
VISSSQRPLPDNTRHSQQTNIHAPGGSRTHDLSRRAAANTIKDFRKNSVKIIKEVKNIMEENQTKHLGPGRGCATIKIRVCNKIYKRSKRKDESKEYHKESRFEKKQKRKIGKER